MPLMRSVCACLVLSVCASAFALDFKIGPDVRLDSFSLCAGANNYLAVWRDLRDLSTPHIRACTVSPTGVSSGEILVSDPAGSAIDNAVQRISVAFDGTNYIAVWADNRSGGAGIYARRIAPDASLIGAEIFVAPIARNTQILPQVAFTGADHVIAWQDTAPTSTSNASQIFYARLSNSNVPSAVSSVALATSASSHKLFAVTTGSENEVLITFLDTGVNPVTTRAIRVSAGNALLTGAEGLLISEAGFGALGFGSPLGAFFINGDYSILSSLGTRIDSSVFRIRILSDNRIIRSSNPLADVPQGTTNLDEDSHPRAYFDGVDEFLFVRNIQANETTYHLITKRVKLDGKDRDPNMFVIDSASQGVLEGAIAVNIGTQYLVGWMDGRRDSTLNRQTNLYGLLLDGTVKGDEGTGSVKAVARAAPTIGINPLTTQFGVGGSTGTLDESGWDFGDGESTRTLSPVHKYESSGDFLAVLSLNRRGLSYRDYVRIFVDSKTKGALGGLADTVAGTLVTSSANLNLDLFISSFGVTMNYAKADNDYFRIFGYINPAQIPFTQTDVPVNFTLGTRTYSMVLDQFGQFKSATGAKPQVRYAMNRVTGTFEITSSFDNLRDLLAPFGVTNTTILKPGLDVTVPIALAYNDTAITETLTGVYTATAGKNGVLKMQIGPSGYPSTGYLRVFNVSAKERGKKGAAVHQFGVVGAIGIGGPNLLKKAATGVWRVSFGNYTESIPVDKIVESKQGYRYLSPRGAVGVAELYYNFNNGSFGILWNNLPAEGDTPSGFPIALSPTLRADMALNLELDLEGQQFSAGYYTRFVRKKSNAKKWGPR